MLPANVPPTPAQPHGPSDCDGGIAAILIPQPDGRSHAPNQQPAGAVSLYQACIDTRDRLWRLPGFGPAFLATAAAPPSASDADGAPLDPCVEGMGFPVTHLWHVLRLGVPLCVIFNKLQTQKPIQYPQLTPEQGEPCCPGGQLVPRGYQQAKRYVAQFIMNLQSQLGFKAEDNFTVSQLYVDDTNGLVKVLHVISKLLDIIESQGGLLAPEDSQNPNRNDTVGFSDQDSSQASAAGGTSKQISYVVKELLESERRYVHDLERMQSFAKFLHQKSSLSADTLHDLFGNLDRVVDFQRRFLIYLEDNARRPPEQQRFGQIFISLQAELQNYGLVCCNFYRALDIASKEAPNIRVRRQTYVHISIQREHRPYHLLFFPAFPPCALE